MAISEIATVLNSFKTALDVIKGVRDMLPRNDAEKVSIAIANAEAALARSDAELAKALDYRLCQCMFPPQIMLWRKAERAHVCPNPACGDKKEVGETMIMSVPKRRDVMFGGSF
jgi:hypothetical protein